MIVLTFFNVETNSFWWVLTLWKVLFHKKSKHWELRLNFACHLICCYVVLYIHQIFYFWLQKELTNYWSFGIVIVFCIADTIISHVVRPVRVYPRYILAGVHLWLLHRKCVDIHRVSVHCPGASMDSLAHSLFLVKITF